MPDGSSLENNEIVPKPANNSTLPRRPFLKQLGALAAVLATSFTGSYYGNKAAEAQTQTPPLLPEPTPTPKEVLSTTSPLAPTVTEIPKTFGSENTNTKLPPPDKIETPTSAELDAISLSKTLASEYFPASFLENNPSLAKLVKDVQENPEVRDKMFSTEPSPDGGKRIRLFFDPRNEASEPDIEFTTKRDPNDQDVFHITVAMSFGANGQVRRRNDQVPDMEKDQLLKIAQKNLKVPNPNQWILAGNMFRGTFAGIGPTIDYRLALNGDCQMAWTILPDPKKRNLQEFHDPKKIERA